MKSLSEIYLLLEELVSFDAKLQALKSYFEQTAAEDLLWSISLLLNKSNARIITITKLKDWALAHAKIPEWLYNQCHPLVKDQSETLALLLPNTDSSIGKTLSAWMLDIEHHKKLNLSKQETFVVNAWKILNSNERILFNKLITGNLRFSLSQQLILHALHLVFNKPIHCLAHRLITDFDAFDKSFRDWLNQPSRKDIDSKPYPFVPIKKLSSDVFNIGEARHWLGIYGYDGISVQWIKRNEQVFIWNDKMELISLLFPELTKPELCAVDKVVLQGTIILMKDDQMMDQNFLTSRVKRKNISKKLLLDFPAKMIINEVLEYNGEDISERSWNTQRNYLEQLYPHLDNHVFLQSNTILSDHWESFTSARKEARNVNASHLVLKNKVKTKDKTNWLWALDPLTVYATLIYVESSIDRRNISSLTFGVWDNKKLIPICKVENTLSKNFETELQIWLKKNTIEKFGPVKSVQPFFVFEISFESITENKRKKSGISLKSAKLGKYLKEMKAENAHTISILKEIQQKHIK